MRSVSLFVLSVAIFAGAAPSLAADLDYGVLRGSDEDVYVPPADWSGVYVGAHGGYTTTNFDYGHAGRSELSQMLHNSTIESEYNISTSNQLRDARAHGGSFGALLGYNYQFEDIVVGVEADYTSVNQKGSAFGFLGRGVTLNGGAYNVYQIDTHVRTSLRDYATLRGRIGYAMGSFMPFVTGGIAVGRAIVGTNVDFALDEYASATETTPNGGLRQSAGSVKEKYDVGLALGVGADFLITQNVFLRGEYQYLQFDRFGDTRVSVNTVRGALGVKF